MSNIVPFKFGETNVRVIEDDSGAFEVVAKDVAEGLGYNWQANLIAHVPEEWKGVKPINTPGGVQQMATLKEPGLYFFLGRSDKPDALPMQKWVSGEVLPSIRKTGSYSAPTANSASQSGLPEFRRARALDLATKTAERITAQFPNLSENSRQVIFAKVINPVAGFEILALPRVEKKHRTAGEVGEILGITGTMVGRIANLHNLKTPEHGEYHLDKSRHSDKQVESWVYNDKGVEAVRQHMASSGPRLAASDGAADGRAA